MHTTRTNGHNSSATSIILTLTGRLLSSVAARIARSRDRRRVRALLALDDRTLRDIGISYGDVYEAVMARGSVDPSDLLNRRRAENLARRGPIEPAKVNHVPAVSSALTAGHWQS